MSSGKPKTRTKKIWTIAEEFRSTKAIRLNSRLRGEDAELFIKFADENKSNDKNFLVKLMLKMVKK